ncbi:MAG: phosphoribosylformylglycinamidine cyclo-ligase, partial [Gemmatimonadota bacterium]
MTVREPLTYRDAGVDLDAAAVTKQRLRELVESTRTGAVQSGFGSFGGRVAVAGEELVASADGVGTKLEVAIRSGRHDTVGEDLVNHCVND